MNPDFSTTPMYLELLKKCLTGTIHVEPFQTLQPSDGGKKLGRMPRWLQLMVLRTLGLFCRWGGVEIVRRAPADPAIREEGKDWPSQAETMIGRKRLDQLQKCIEEVLRLKIPGDFIECGVWRGGATIFMRAALKAYNDNQRRVWVADSFQGLPAPDATHYPADRGDVHHHFWQLAVSLEDVKANFARYDLLDDQVQFLRGWFKDTLPAAPIQQLSILRADGDMYESTIQILDNLYPKLSQGGFCIIDDYGAVEGCRKATDDFRRDHGISVPLQKIDWTGVQWQKNNSR